jgi:hypothetical protein
MNGSRPNGPCQPPKNNVTSRAEIGDDTDVLTHEEHAPFHAGVFNVVTVGQFLFRFRLVERVTVSHGHASDKEGHETEESAE